METIGISPSKGMMLLLLLIVTLVHILLKYKLRGMNTHAEKRFKEHLDIIAGQKNCYNLGEGVKINKKTTKNQQEV